jgi:iron complex transport system substrate-binding protein
VVLGNRYADAVRNRVLIAATCVAIACGLLASNARAQPRRVVSANLCADQLLMALADPDQIASLSPLARDGRLSFLADSATRFPANSGHGEDIVRLDADLALVGPYDSRFTRALLAARAMRFEVLEPWQGFDDVRKGLRDFAALVGHADRAERLVAEIDDGLRSIDALRARSATALVLHRRGFVYSSGLIAEIARRAGLVDVAPRLGVESSGFVSLEALVAARPEFLIVSDRETEAIDQGQAFLAHPALLRYWPRERRLVLPDRLTICGGPSTPALIAQFVTEISAKVK